MSNFEWFAIACLLISVAWIVCLSIVLGAIMCKGGDRK